MKLVKRRWARALAAALAVLLLAAALPTAALAATVQDSGTMIRLTATEGTVTVKNGSGQKKTVLNNMQLYSGWTVETASGALAWLSIDANTENAKVIKLGGSGKVELRKNGLKNDILLHSGQVFFSSENEMKDNETLTIYTSAGICGIRGSSGVASLQQVMFGTGHGTYSTLDNLMQILQTLQLRGSQMVRMSAIGGTATLLKARVTDFPTLYLNEVKTNESLQKAIDREGNYSFAEMIAAIPAAEAREAAGNTGGSGTVTVEGADAKGKQVDTWGAGGLLEQLGVKVEDSNTGNTGGGGAAMTPTYAVNIASGIEHGAVTASQSSAAAGVPITLTATPAEGYQLTALTVTDADNSPVTVTDNSFTMPAKAVTVTATFTAIEYKITPALWSPAAYAQYDAHEVLGISVNGEEIDDCEPYVPAHVGDEITLWFEVDNNETIPIVGLYVVGDDTQSKLTTTERNLSLGGDKRSCYSSFTMPAQDVTVSDEVLNRIYLDVVVENAPLPDTEVVTLNTAGYLHYVSQGDIWTDVIDYYAAEGDSLTLSATGGFELKKIERETIDDTYTVISNPIEMPGDSISLRATVSAKTFTITAPKETELTTESVTLWRMEGYTPTVQVEFVDGVATVRGSDHLALYVEPTYHVDGDTVPMFAEATLTGIPLTYVINEYDTDGKYAYQAYSDFYPQENMTLTVAKSRQGYVAMYADGGDMVYDLLTTTDGGATFSKSNAKINSAIEDGTTYRIATPQNVFDSYRPWERGEAMVEYETVDLAALNTLDNSVPVYYQQDLYFRIMYAY